MIDVSQKKIDVVSDDDSLAASTFQMRIVRSYDPETTRLLSCENATDVTRSAWNATDTIAPVRASQMRIVQSFDPETTSLLSCENATEVTQSAWPRNGPE